MPNHLACCYLQLVFFFLLKSKFFFQLIAETIYLKCHFKSLRNLKRWLELFCLLNYLGGCHSVIVIVVGNGYNDLNSNLDEAVWFSHSTKEKAMHSTILPPAIACPVGWGCRIHQLHLCREVVSVFHSVSLTDSFNKCPGCNIKPSDDEAPVLEFWGIWSTLSLLLLPGPFRPKVAAPNRILSIG